MKQSSDVARGELEINQRGLGRLILRFSRSTPHKTYTDGGDLAIVGIVIHAIQSVKYHSQR